ncbi:MAG: ABC transporter ATP-binding protein, partial [Chloroflexi bacterium]|nr:ABC transporter ATP-binding protein [Chloroflexota bacterium]
GKTTTVKLLLGLTRPTSGSASLLGAPIGDLETRRRVGYLPELFRYQPWLRAREVVDLHADLIGFPHRHRKRAIGDALELVGLAERAGDLVGTFSKGMQQRLGLAVSLFGSPELVFLDEPTSALDPLGRVDVRAIIRTIRERGAAVFLNSHLLTEVELVCDRVAIVARGEVVAEGPLDDVLGAPEVEIRVTGLEPAALAELEDFGTPTLDGDRLRIRGMDVERVPDLVAALVGRGCRIHAVDAGRRSLEERFIDLVGGEGRDAGAAA